MIENTSLVSTAEAVAVQPASKPRRGAWAWPVATVMITLILVIGVPVGYLMVRAATLPGRLATTISQAAADALRPKVSINEVVMTSLAEVRKENKLVVLTTDISADVTREEGATSFGMYWGTNVARVAVKDAHVQWVIDCNKMGTSDYIYNEQAKVLSITFPRPHVDSSMVAIDPGHVRTLDLRGGWARFDKQETRQNALAELRPKVLVQADTPYVREYACNRGIEATTRLLQPMADALNRDGVTLRVAYRD
jgi:hypothetical protein